VQTDYDVIVVGGGGSGLATAVSAAQHGLNTLILEKQPELGGSTGIAVGTLTANRTIIQEKAGIQDTLEAHIEDAGMFAPPETEKRNNNDLRRWFLSHTGDTLQWLIDMGLTFYGPNPEPPNRVPRMHNVIPGAKAYITILHAKLVHYGGALLTNTPVVDLIQKDKRVIGVCALVNGQRKNFIARRGVVLAAGDYTNSQKLISRFKGEQFSGIEGINPHMKGDGHLLAESIGAKLVNMDITYGPELRFIAPKRHTFQQLLPSQGPLVRVISLLMPYIPRFVMNMFLRRLLVTWQHPEDSLFSDGAILINQKGERFCDEKISPAREIAIARQPGKICYILFDQRLVKQYSQWPNFVSTAPKIAYAYVADYLKLRPDIAVMANTIKEIANHANIPQSQLLQTLEETNKERLTQGKPLLKDSPWVLLGPAKAYFTTTEGGVAINKHFQALNKHDQPIPGLYAVGQNGLGGQILWGHGLHIAWAITSGRLLGEYLAERSDTH